MKDKYYELNNERTEIVKAMADIFEFAVSEMKYNVFSFTEILLKSDVFDRFPYDFSLFSQSPKYVINVLIKEENKESILMNKKMMEDINYWTETAYWFGYMVESWAIVDNIKGIDLLNKYDVKEIILSYPRLHCMSITAAVNEAKSDFALETREMNEKNF